MAQATWHSPSHGFHPRGGLFRDVRPPSEETGLVIAIAAILVVVAFLYGHGDVRPSTDDNAGIGIEGVTVSTSLEGPPVPAVVPPPIAAVAPLAAVPVVPTSPDTAPPQSRPQTIEAAPPAQAPRIDTSVRAVDLESLPAVRNLTLQTGATIDPALVSYGNLAGAGEVALVPLQSGGSAGTLAVAVVGTGSDGAQVLALLTPDSASRGKIRAGFEGDQIVVTSAILGPEDALCCPSQIKQSYYTWDGSKLQLERKVTSESAPSVKS